MKPKPCNPPKGTEDNTVHVLGTPFGVNAFWLWKDRKWWFPPKPTRARSPTTLAKATWFYVGDESKGIADGVRADAYDHDPLVNGGVITRIKE